MVALLTDESSELESLLGHLHPIARSLLGHRIEVEFHVSYCISNSKQINANGVEVFLKIQENI